MEALIERLEVAGVLGAPPIGLLHDLDPLEPHAVLGKAREIAYQLPNLDHRGVELEADAVAQLARREV